MNGLVYAGLYRNKMRDVQSFLKEKHSSDGYCVYNLCTEEHFAYKPSNFEQVANFPFDDHQVGSHSPLRGRSFEAGRQARHSVQLHLYLMQASLFEEDNV